MNPAQHPEQIYKVVTRDVFDTARAAGAFPRMPVDAGDGYVHFSTASQLAETLKRHFAGQPDLVVFAMKTRQAGAGLRWEPSRGGQLFPHVYGEIAMPDDPPLAILSVAADGSVVLPDWVK